MEQEHHEIEHVPKDVGVLDGSNGTNLVDKKDFKDAAAAAAAAAAVAAASKEQDEKEPEYVNEMRAAAASKEQDEKEPEYVNEMRGWLLTVATLFVSMAFDAMLHPPEWMKTQWYEQGLTTVHGPRWFRTHHRDDDDDYAAAAAIINNHPSHAAAAAVAPSPQSAAAAIASTSEVVRAYLYLSFNSLTFAMALVLVVMLLQLRRRQVSSDRRMDFMKAVLGAVSFSLALTFALGTSNNWMVSGIACLALLVYACAAAYYIVFSLLWEKILRKLISARTKQQAAKQSPSSAAVAEAEPAGSV